LVEVVGFGFDFLDAMFEPAYCLAASLWTRRMEPDRAR
jgi:hypothetical protein